MTKKLKISFGLTTSLLLLSACSSVTAEEIYEATEEIDQQFESFLIVEENLHKQETNLDSQFQTLLDEDEELENLQDESAEALQNIHSREEELNQFEDQAYTIKEKAGFITEYEGDELDTAAVHQASEQFLNFSQIIQNYKEIYQESIDLQKEYFNQIASEEADYELFLEGMNELNNNYLSLQEFKESLEEEVHDTSKTINDLKELTITEDPDNEKINEENSEEENSEEETEKVDEKSKKKWLTINTDQLLTFPRKLPKQFTYDSGVDIDYPEGGVKGIYTTAHSAGGDRMDSLVELINNTDLNSMVIDIKDDYGNITLDLDSDNELVNEMTNEIIETESLMNTLKGNNIYPIARIVVFKDSLLAESEPSWSFTEKNGSVWKNRRGESFVNPYLEEVWDYNIEVAIQAAKLGFKDIQFDYVRFPEGFENREDSLTYTHGKYTDDSKDVINMEYRNRAVTEFVRKSKESLMPYGAELSVDIFGYAALVRETPGIGQSFPGIAKEVDVISSMIYPSHWGPGNLDISKPDLEPYNVVNNYIAVEAEIFAELGDEAPVTRPWLQDFTASYLGAGNYKSYGAAEVTAQVEALADNGIYEFLLWNAGNRYSEGAKYTFE